MAEDLAPGGRWLPGGPSLYSARLALNLGAAVTLVTALSAGYDRKALAGLDVRSVAVATVTRYANSYDAEGARTQRLAWAGEALPASLLTGVPEADVIIAAPAFHELEAFPAAAARVRGLALQGLLRETRPDGLVRPRPEPWREVERFVERGMFVFFSIEDTAEPAALAKSVAARGATCFVTAGSAGASRFEDGAVWPIAAFPAHQADPTGAGDCFATAFLIRYAESGSMEGACAFATATGALAVETEGGPLAVPARAAIEARLGMVVA